MLKHTQSRRRALFIGLALLGLPLLVAPESQAAWEPTRPVTWIVNASEGGGADTAARATVKAIQSVSKVRMVIENIGGAGGKKGLAEWLRRPLDGHTLMFGAQSAIAYSVQGLVGYTMADVEPIAMMQDGPATLLSRGDDTRFANFDEMVAYVKAGNSLKVAVYSDSPDFFDTWTLSAIKQAKGIDFRAIPYPAASDRYSALLRGETDLLTQRIGDVIGLIQAGKMKPLLVNRAAVASEFPGLPTFQEKGIPFEVGFWRGVWMRAGNPPESIEFMAGLFARALASPSWKAFEEKTGYRGGVKSRADFIVYVKEETDFISRLLKK
jgi:putative tricarboxylic transport membrane protein